MSLKIQIFTCKPWISSTWFSIFITNVLRHVLPVMQPSPLFRLWMIWFSLRAFSAPLSSTPALPSSCACLRANSEHNPQADIQGQTIWAEAHRSRQLLISDSFFESFLPFSLCICPFAITSLHCIVFQSACSALFICPSPSLSLSFCLSLLSPLAPQSAQIPLASVHHQAGVCGCRLHCTVSSILSPSTDTQCE